MSLWPSTRGNALCPTWFAAGHAYAHLSHYALLLLCDRVLVDGVKLCPLCVCVCVKRLAASKVFKCAFNCLCVVTHRMHRPASPLRLVSHKKEKKEKMTNSISRRQALILFLKRGFLTRTLQY